MKRIISAIVSAAMAFAVFGAVSFDVNSVCAEPYSDNAVKLESNVPSQKFITEVMLPYQYSELSDQAQKCYIDIRKAIAAHKNSVKISSRISEKTLIRIADIMQSQDPLVFDNASIEFNGVSTDNAYARLTYAYTKGVSDSTLKQVIKEADKVIAAFAPDADDYAKFLAVHDYIVNSTEYDETDSKPFVRTVYGSLILGRGVSEGYAYAFQFISIKAGLTSIIVSGTDADGNLHTWNKVKLSGEWYNIDCSQDDLGACYDYFMVNDEVMQQTFTESRTDYPAATDDSMAYSKKFSDEN